MIVITSEIQLCPYNIKGVDHKQKCIISNAQLNRIMIFITDFSQSKTQKKKYFTGFLQIKYTEKKITGFLQIKDTEKKSHTQLLLIIIL